MGGAWSGPCNGVVIISVFRTVPTLPAASEMTESAAAVTQGLIAFIGLHHNKCAATGAKMNSIIQIDVVKNFQSRLAVSNLKHKAFNFSVLEPDHGTSCFFKDISIYQSFSSFYCSVFWI